MHDYMPNLICWDIMPCSGLVGSMEIPNWNWEFPFFPSGLCPKLLDDTNECQYILVHKIHWQLKLYHCNASLYTYIQQNNQKVEEKQKKLPIRLLFRLMTSLSDFRCALQNPKFPNGISHIRCHRTVFPSGKFGISIIPMTSKHHISWLCKKG